MTLLGKVFILLTLLLSGIFFTLALAINASHTNWRDVVTGPNGYEAQIKKMQATINELKSAIEKAQNELATEQAARRIALASLQTQLAEQQEVLKEKEKNLLELQATRRLNDDTLSRTSQDLERLTQENSEIKKLIDQTIQDRNDQRAKVISLTDEFNSLQSVYADAKAREEQLRDENTTLEARTSIMRATLTKAGLSEDPDDAPPDGVHGLILAIGRDNMVEVSLGRDDGMKVDHELEVFRGTQYLGKIRIIKIADDKSIGVILKDYRNGLIQKGDKVAAKLG
jgi:myosin heavy subunit